MLQTLRNRNASEIQFVLSNLATQVLPNPIQTEGFGSKKTSSLKNEVIAEIRKKLNLALDDYSYEAITKIQRVVADEMTRSIFADVDLNSVRNRLGQKGQLSQNLYTFKFEEIYYKFGGVGVRKSEVLELLRKPDDYQHLHPKYFQEGEEKSVSLFTKTNICEDESKTYTLLISGQRQGFVQSISQAWKIYHNEVDLSHSESPYDILRVFVDKFGLEISVSDNIGKFFWNETHSVKSSSETDLVKIMQNPMPKWVLFAQVFPTEDLIKIAHAYAINLDTYWDSLRRHGILI